MADNDAAVNDSIRAISSGNRPEIEKNLRILRESTGAIQLREQEALPALVNLLADKNARVRYLSMQLIHRMMSDKEAARNFVEEGHLKSIVNLYKTSYKNTRFWAGATLGEASKAGYAKEVVDAGATPEIIRNAGMDNGSALALKALAKAGETEALVMAGAIQAILKGPSFMLSIRKKTLAEGIHCHLLETLAEITLWDAGKVVESGGIRRAMRLLDDGNPWKVRCAAAGILSAIAAGGRSNDVKKAGAPESLVAAMRDSHLIKASCDALNVILGRDWGGFVFDNGGVDILVDHFDAKDAFQADNGTREEAMKAMCDIFSCGHIDEFVGKGYLDTLLFKLYFDPETSHDITYMPSYHSLAQSVLDVLSDENIEETVKASAIPVFVRRLNHGGDLYGLICAADAMLRYARAGYEKELEKAGGVEALRRVGKHEEDRVRTAAEEALKLLGENKVR